MVSEVLSESGKLWQPMPARETQTMPETFLTIPEAARLLRVAERTVYTLARRGDLPGAVKVGNQWRIDRTTLMEWVRGQARETRERSHHSGGTD